MLDSKGVPHVAAEFLTRLAQATGDNTMPIQQVMTLLAVHLHGEVNMIDLGKFTGVEKSSNSRNVAKLGPGMNPLEPGLGLVEAYEDPFNRRFKKVRMTPKGKALVDSVARETAANVLKS